MDGTSEFAAGLGEFGYLVAAHVVDEDLAKTHLVIDMHERKVLLGTPQQVCRDARPAGT